MLNFAQKLKWELVDMGSLNGTLLNSRPINHPDSGSRHWGDPFDLASGDTITLGTTSVVSVSQHALLLICCVLTDLGQKSWSSWVTPWPIQEVTCEAFWCLRCYYCIPCEILDMILFGRLMWSWLREFALKRMQICYT